MPVIEACRLLSDWGANKMKESTEYNIFSSNITIMGGYDFIVFIKFRDSCQK